MKVLWLCNMMPGAVREAQGGTADGGLWLDHVLSDLRRQETVSLRICCPAGQAGSGKLDDSHDYFLFTEGLPYVYLSEMEDAFSVQLQQFRPDVIHIWGTEYGHTLAMVNAAVKLGMRSRVVVSIQGLCGPYTPHYAEGLPESVVRGYTFRDLLRKDNIEQQRQKFALRGQLEKQALQQTDHVIGRTGWDAYWTEQINPGRTYHYCCETLRDAFYQGCWKYSECTPHSIFASSCLYPIKGFHYLLEAMPAILKKYPDAVIHVTGDSFFPKSLSDSLRMESYTRYLIKLCRKYSLEDRITFTGRLNADGMKQEYREANVFVLPSTIENSPNSLGEAMLQGVPCVAADVGGVKDMMSPEEGWIYPSGRTDQLAEFILAAFDQEEKAERIGQAARVHALHTHDPEKNLQDLLSIYRTIANL